MDSRDPLDWENWTGELPFWQHALCGSIAGVMEHISLFPLDTIKTRLQTDSTVESSSPGQNGSSRSRYNRFNNIPLQKANTSLNGINNLMSGLNTDIAHINNTSSTDTSKTTTGVVNRLSGRTNNRLNRDSTSKINEKLNIRSNKLINKIVSNRNIATEALISPMSLIGSLTQVTAHKNNLTNISANLTETPNETANAINNHNLVGNKHSSSVNGANSVNSSFSKSNGINSTINISRSSPCVVSGHETKMVTNRNITSKILNHLKPINRAKTGFYSNLFRGSNVIIVGCIPAHVLYFTVYEKIKSAGNIAASGAAATFCHDLLLTPADVIKQRLQLGCYRSSRDCLYNIIRHEGVKSLFRSFHITLMMNVPYHSLLVSIMHLLRSLDGARTGSETSSKDVENYKHFVYAGFGGAVAGALTTPFDVIKTRLQTQACQMDAKRPKLQIKYRNVMTTFVNIYRKEGVRGFMRGVTTRVGMCTPSAAISWGTYESLKNLIKLMD